VEIIDQTPIMVQDARPGMYVADADGIFARVVEYPIIAGAGVFINCASRQIGPLPLDHEDVAIWA
jgi:hypothetical protein